MSRQSKGETHNPDGGNFEVFAIIALIAGVIFCGSPGLFDGVFTFFANLISS